jgi:sugar O-acyltransferase (sialic acid O-acetyltransferase NeuD family)
MTKIGLFGVRSPISVEFEETCHRLGIDLAFGLSVSGTPRMIDMTKVVDLKNIDALDNSIRITACAFSPKRRQELINLAAKYGFELAEPLIDPTVITPRSFRADVGSFLNAGVVIGAVTSIGQNVLINRSASIGHHCRIDDFVSIGPRAVLAGNIKVGRMSIIGAGAVIQPDVSIGDGVIVAAGTVVRKNVPDNSLISGNPGKMLSRKPSRSSLSVEGEE